ncbi:hypothetical protein DVS28_b0223 (plasmid) [Euzebya pacifica]|uniref:Uncharacterized protein n=1 Tax=Euzebya pacifica TaxID=1608957 RepID=A0A346Y696_9ACTN|nr:hypothetical protein DVS28_b0223 [Euzebya pacifica]
MQSVEIADALARTVTTRALMRACFPRGDWPTVWNTSTGTVTRLPDGTWRPGSSPTTPGEQFTIGSAPFNARVRSDCVLAVLLNWMVSATDGVLAEDLQQAAVDGAGPLGQLLAVTSHRARMALPDDGIELYRVAPAGTPMWPLLSWTSQKRVAKLRARAYRDQGLVPLVMRSIVPVDRIMGSYRTGLGSPGEFEYVTSTVDAVRALGPG